MPAQRPPKNCFRSREFGHGRSRAPGDVQRKGPLSSRPCSVIFFLNTTGSAYEAIPGGAAGDGGSGQARKGGGILDREGYDQL